MVETTIQKLLGVSIFVFLYGLLSSYLRLPFLAELVITAEICMAIFLILRTLLFRKSVPFEIITYIPLACFFLFRALSGFETESNYFSSLSLISLVIFFIAGIIHINKNKAFRFSWPSNFLIAGLGFFFMATLFKILHWQGAQILLILAIALVAVWNFFSFIWMPKKK